MIRKSLVTASLAVGVASTSIAGAVSSAELYQNQRYTYGRFEARVRFAAGDGVISSFFLWKPGSEVAGTFWNELDFEKLGADCRMQTNALYGAPVVDRGQLASISSDLCGGYHTYAFEWAPAYIAWLIDGVEVRREAGEAAAAFALNAAAGMQVHFNLWPGDASFGGDFDAAILPVHQYVSWVQYSSLSNGSFTLEWREDFTAAGLPSGWSIGNWSSPKNYSTHAPANVGFTRGIAVLSLTADGVTGFAGEPPPDQAGGLDAGGGSGAGGSAGAAGAAGGTSGNAPGAAASAGRAVADDAGGCSVGARGAVRSTAPCALAVGLIALATRRRAPRARARRLRSNSRQARATSAARQTFHPE